MSLRLLIGDADIPLTPALKVLVVDDALEKLKVLDHTLANVSTITELEDIKHQLLTHY